MGAPKKVTVSYWYKLIAHFGFAKGPVDAMLEWRGGDRVIWQGRQEESGIISVNKPDLYGGESAEGGVVGDFELLMGDEAQAPSGYLAGIFGALQSAYRGRLTGILRGAKIGAGNPYPKPFTFKFVRILKGWDDDVCWYPEKAGIASPAPTSYSVFDESFVGVGLGNYTVTSGSAAGFSAAGVTMTIDGTLGGIIERQLPVEGLLSEVSLRFRVTEHGPDDFATIDILDSAGYVFGFNLARQSGFDALSRPTSYVMPSGGPAGAENPLGAAAATVGRLYYFSSVWNGSNGFDTTLVDMVTLAVVDTGFIACATRPLVERMVFRKEVSAGSDGSGTIQDIQVKVQQIVGDQLAMNPAHILYDSITSRKENGGMGEPVGRINDASFTAAADRAFAEGFGLCTTWRGGESALQFQQRICNVVGWNCSQDILDGQYYIDMLRGDYVLGELPIITDDDILNWKAESNSLTESINHLSVAWYDQEKMESRVTTPIQSLGAIESAGGVIPDVREYYEIPYESLALRVADRDLSAVATPQWRFQITANRRALALRRPGRYFRLMAPNRGFADMVCVVSEIGFGSFDNGAIQFSAVQDVFSLKDSVFVDPQDTLDDPPGGTALPPPASVAIESPYVELASALATADREALTVESGYLQIGAARPTGSLNYAVATRITGGEFEAAGANADWTPTALMAESLLVGVPETVIAYTNGSLLDNVVIGTWALWGDEIVRVDAIDQVLDTMTLARGCGDTVPQPHAADERIWFIGDWYGTDNKEYADSESVEAKALTRTGADQLAPASAATLTVVMDSRQARPYPPGKLRITDLLATDAAYPASAVGALTPTWTHRDRLLQDDQLVPEGDASVGPEAGTTYNVRYYLDNVLDSQELGVVGTTATPDTLSGDGLARVEVESVRGGLVSWQAATAEFSYTVSPLDARITDNSDTRIIDSGDRRVLD